MANLKPRLMSVEVVVDGVKCRTIPLTQGQSALVDVSDYEWLNHWNWYAWWNKATRTFYAVRTAPVVNHKHWGRVYMHRQILGLDYGDQRTGDHRETGKTLDNRRSNLRIATQTQNNQNMRKSRLNTSGFKGVYYRKGKGKWVAQIKHNGQWVYLGLHETVEGGHAAYCEAAKKFHGEFARTA